MWEQLTRLRKKYLDLHLDQAINYEKFSMISIIYHSTKIEGLSLTETDTKVLLDKDITAKGKPLADHLMVRDHFEALLFLKEQAAAKRPISLGFLKEVAAMVMKHTGGPVKTISGEFDTSKGDLRLAPVYVDKKYFPDYRKIESLLHGLIDNVNQRINTVEGNSILKLSADFHYNLVNIHPFGDGNGRASRLMMNYVQLYHGEPLVKIFSEDRTAYIDALNTAEEMEDISIFQDFICQQQIKFYQLEIDKYKKRNSGFTLLF